MPPPNIISLAFAVQEKKGELDIYEASFATNFGNFDQTVYADMLGQYRIASERLQRAIIMQMHLHRERYPEDWETQFARMVAIAIERAGQES